MSTCRTICANGSRPGRRPRAISSSRSTSIRRAFCEAVAPHRHCEESEAIQSHGRDSGLVGGFASGKDGFLKRKKACRHWRRQAFLSTQASLRLYATQRLQKCWKRKRRLISVREAYETTSAVTWPTPEPVRPTARA